MIKFIFYISLPLALVVLLYLNITLFTSPFLNSVNNHVPYYENTLGNLKQELHLGIARDMQQLFPEGYCFTNLLYGLSIVEFISYIDDKEDISYWQNEVKWSIKQLESDYATHQFDTQLNPTYGAFYHSWYTWLLGKYISTFPYGEADSTSYTKFNQHCDQIVKNYLNERNCYPSSYKDLSYPGDVIIGIVALKLSDQISDKNYDPFIYNWLSTVKSQLNDTTTLIPHSIQNGIIEKERGSSQSLTLRFLYEIDSTFAKTQYRLFNSKFVKSFFSFSLIREYEDGGTPIEDIDSGPVIFGFGSVASIVGIGTSKFFLDSNLYSDLNIVIEILHPAIKYFFADLVITDLFLLWSRISHPIDSKKDIDNLLYIDHIKYTCLIVFILLLLLMLYLIFGRRINPKGHK